MFRVLGIDHLVLRARDFRGLIAFYEKVIGCEVERDVSGLGLAQLRAGRSLLDIVDTRGPLGRVGGSAPAEEGRNLDHFCLRVEPWEPEAIAEHLRAHGVDPTDVAQRYGAEGDGPSLYVTDPEGNVIELRGPPTESR